MVLIALQLVGVTSAAAAQPHLVAVPAGTMDGQSRLIVDLPGTGGSPVPPGSFSVAVNGIARPTRAGPLLSDRLAMALVVDASQAAAPVLQPGLNGVADFALPVSSAIRTTLVADTTPPAVVSALQPGAVELLRGLSALQFRGDRQTVAALDLAVAQLPPEPDNPRLVVLYTAAPEATGRSPAELGARLAAAGVVLAVVTTAGDGGPVPPYWSLAAAATGGVAVSARGPDAVDAFARLATALGTRYLLTFPAPDQLPATAVVRVDTPSGPLTADAIVPAGAPAGARPDV